MASSAFEEFGLPGELPAVIRSEAVIRLMLLVERIARSTATVLIQGETGSGKEMIARAIHQLSSRSKYPLIDINCAALPEHLIESELFGHEKGAFSGADTMKPGMFELADGGTLLLDEIGELDPRTQAKLLRVLDGSPYFRLGGTRKVSVDVRVIAATNRDLRNSVDGAKFRPDLFFRLSQMQLFVPPLRERPADIEAIAEQILSQHRPGSKLNRDAMDALLSYSWPGNIRELKNVIIATLLNLDSDRNVIQVTDLPPGVCEPDTDHRPDPASGDLDSMERKMIERSVRENNGDLGAAAEQLGISRRTMSRKIRAYQLSSPKYPLGALCAEQHRYFRAVLDRPVLLRSSQGYEMKIRSVNLSSSGIGVRQIEDFSKCSEIVELHFDLGEDESKINVKGRLSWTDAEGGAGIRFVGMPRAAQQLIDDWITRKRVEEGWIAQPGCTGAQ